MLTQRQQRQAAREFAKKWEGIGYEKGDSARFWLSLLNEVFGVDKPADYMRFEDQVMLDHTSFIDGFIPSTHVLIEQKSIDKDLRKGIRQSDGSILSPFQQAKRYSIELPYDDRPRWIVLSNFKEFHIYDMNKPQAEPEVVYLKDLEEDYYRLNFLVDEREQSIKKALEVSIKAGELVGVLYDALLKQYQDPEDSKTLQDLNVLCVRLVFCFYAEDAGLFGKHNMFHDYLSKFKDSPSSFRTNLIQLFKILDQKEEERDPYLSDDLLAFPYVNGGLFAKDDIIIPRVNEEIINIILDQASAGFDWSKISPTIFGGVFESTLNPETRRSGGMHYTSIENIHKLIDPLFMDELRAEFQEAVEIKTLNIKQKKLRELQDKIASLKFLDPAAGSGNFLTETYLTLRRLENEILKELYGNQIVMGQTHNPIKVSIRQFYGIEINDFAVSVARTALWIAESQMLKETEDIVNMNLDFFPLKNYPNIIEGNALRIDWEEVVPKNELNYIMGNPPFVGHQYRNKSQINDMLSVFGSSGYKKLDYVCSWFKKSAEYIEDNAIYIAFVSTNSITQGEQANLMSELFKELDLIINYAYETFVWTSEAHNKAAVHCTIIGFSRQKYQKNNKFIFNNSNQGKKVNHINNYILDAPDIILKNRSEAPKNMMKMIKGSQPTDGGGLIFSEKEHEIFIKKYPNKQYLFKRYMGADDYINNKTRYCLWLDELNPSEYRNIKEIRERLEKVSEIRKKSPTKSVRECADSPYLFTQIRQPDTDYIIVPRVSSERRKYIPIGFVSKEVIASDSTQIIPENSMYLLGILTSNVHMAWMKTICGRLKSDYRYSPFVYNNFPWPNPTSEQKERIEKTAQMILDARNLYPDSSLADLYDDLIMPPELRKAHQENDKAVMEAYGFDWRTMTESECVAELMKLYQALVK
ncbi:N-6 DNA methylase [Ezakiella coagulans]|uniref:site-specific DNA-methyltransferase (adenine-specific) n=1 Tax=Ezakiella coagulans TaxID=46507 RepID=A0A2U1DNE7_9FIRM|nr:DNA methyltransferase [Ezakiella coagulans]PVY89210.1 N-6 DNA methylase [Ezakiella coagulans]